MPKIINWKQVQRDLENKYEEAKALLRKADFTLVEPVFKGQPASKIIKKDIIEAIDLQLTIEPPRIRATYVYNARLVNKSGEVEVEEFKAQCQRLSTIGRKLDDIMSLIGLELKNPNDRRHVPVANHITRTYGLNHNRYI